MGRVWCMPEALFWVITQFLISQVRPGSAYDKNTVFSEFVPSFSQTRKQATMIRPKAMA